MPSSFWDKTKGTSKKGFDKAWNTLDKLGDPVNRLSYRIGSEAFWPMTLDKESDKAARILRSFCKDGFYANEEDSERQSTDSTASKDPKISRPKGKQRVIKKIPTKVIQQAKGLAIFTTMRTGLWFSGSGGSGVLLARIPETGEWSPPSGIMLHTAGVGFLAGVDIYDCVVVINTYEALEAFKKVRCTIGGEVSAAAGPVGIGGVLESEVHKRQAPIWTYMKSRGLYGGVQVDGTIIIERTDENERFFGERISVTDILAGKALHPPSSINTLIQTIKAAQGDADVDESLVPPPGETPGDAEIEIQQSSTFGIPAIDDPDPFGVKALEAEGLFIREAGTKSRPTQDVFDFRPNPGSPIYATFRRSLESSPRNSWRASVQSHASYASMDRGTQTDDAPPTAPTSVSRASSSRSIRDAPPHRLEPHSAWEEDDQWDTVIPEPYHNHNHVERKSEEEEKEDDLAYDDDFEVHEVSSATLSKRGSAPPSPVSLDDPSILPKEVKRQSPTFIRPRLVTIPKRPTPPSLPPRHPERMLPPTSAPASPISVPSPDKQSVADHETLHGLSELPLHPNNDVSSVSSNEVSPSPNQATADRDDFHSVSSAPSWHSGSDTEMSAKEMSDPDAKLEHTKTVTEDDTQKTSLQAQTAAVS